MRASGLRQACRSLARTPWYFATVVGVIALAMALTTAVLAVVDGMMFRPLPYREPDRLFAVAPAHSKLPIDADSGPVWWGVSALELNAWRQAVPDVQLSALRDALYRNDQLEWTSRPFVDANFFETLGVPLRGPGFAAGDFAPGQGAVVLITHAVWQSRYGLDATVVGRTYANPFGRTVRIAGILPAGFVFPSGPWITDTVQPLVMADPGSRARNLKVIARVPVGLTPQLVAERLTSVTRALAASWPPVAERPGMTPQMRILSGPFDMVRLDPLRDTLATSLGTARIVFWAAAALMLLACLNVAGLAVARVQDRRRDLVIRRALGARYADLVRLLATENVVIALAGTALGVWGARALLAATTAVMPRSLRFLKPPVVDARVLAFSAMAAGVSVLLITLLPARAAWGRSLQGWLAGGATVTRRFRRGGLSIVAAQVALVTVLAVGGSLVAGSLLRVWGEDPGFDADRVADLTVATGKAPAGSLVDIMDTIHHLPGVRSAGGIDHPLLEKSFNGNSFDIPEPAVARDYNSLDRLGEPADVIEEIGVTSHYLEAMGLRPIDGRLPTDGEWATGASVIVISDHAAQLCWPGQRAVGQVLMRKGRAFTVVGVVRDARYMSLDMSLQPAIYWPAAAAERQRVYHLVASFDDSGRATLRDVVAAFATRCPACTVYKAEMLSDALGDSIRPRRFNAWLFSSFGIAALAIVGAGILGLVAMTTGRRTREIGIRLALGATRISVVRQILAEQAFSVCAGLLAGGLVAGWAVRYVKSYLYKTALYDVWSWGVAIAVILAVAMLGGLVPSWRASRVDPVRALRVE